MDAVVTVAVRLVNALTPGEAHGRPYLPPTGAARPAAVTAALRAGPRDTDQQDRLGVCAAPRCDRVYVDTSRNATRRFCSTACQNRVKAAAFRAAHPSAQPKKSSASA
jgi:predicted RNA-binding Zn ribbon-like protein